MLDRKHEEQLRLSHKWQPCDDRRTQVEANAQRAVGEPVPTDKGMMVTAGCTCRARSRHAARDRQERVPAAGSPSLTRHDRQSVEQALRVKRHDTTAKGANLMITTELASTSPLTSTLDRGNTTWASFRNRHSCAPQYSHDHDIRAWPPRMRVTTTYSYDHHTLLA